MQPCVLVVFYYFVIFLKHQPLGKFVVFNITVFSPLFSQINNLRLNHFFYYYFCQTVLWKRGLSWSLCFPIIISLFVNGKNTVKPKTNAHILKSIPRIIHFRLHRQGLVSFCVLVSNHNTSSSIVANEGLAEVRWGSVVSCCSLQG